MPRGPLGLFVPLTCALVLLAVPLAADAQPAAKVWRLGLFHVGLDHVPPSLEPLREALQALGYEEGKNMHLDWRNLPDEEAAQKTAQEFVQQRVDLIVAFEGDVPNELTADSDSSPICKSIDE